MIRFALVILAICALVSAPVAAETFQVRTAIQPDRGIEDSQPVQLIVQIVGTVAPEVEVGVLPPMKNLRVIGGPSSQTNHSWVNGKTSSDHRLIWSLLPEGPGKAEIPAFKIRISGEEYDVGNIQFEVAASKLRNPPPPTGTAASATPDEPDIFIEARLGKNDVWVGEAVSLELSLYAAQQGVSNLNYVEQPEFEGQGMWVESDKVDPDRERQTRVLGSRRYLVYPLQRRVIVPSQAGEFDLGKYIIQLSVPVGRRDFFGFSTRSRRVIRESDPLKLRVRTLPGGAPDGFDGLVGSFSSRSSLDRAEAAVDDAVSLRLTLSGAGSLQTVQTPELRLSPDLQAFDPRVVERRFEIGNPSKSQRTWEWVLVPLTPGTLEVPAIEFPYFDPDAGEYRVARSTPIPLTVDRGTGTRDDGTTRTQLRPRRKDLHYLKRLEGGLRYADTQGRGRAYVVAAATPMVLAPLLVWFGRRQERLRQDRGLLRSRRAFSRARKALASLRKGGSQLDGATYHEQMARALVDYVADRFDRSASGMTYELAEELLASRDIDPELRREFRSVLEQCDYARFVPASSRAERREELLEQALRVVNDVERGWN